MAGDTVEVRVWLDVPTTDNDDGRKRLWLNGAGAFLEDESAAMVLHFKRSPTVAEGLRINRLAHELAGGLAEYVGLERGAEAARLAVVAAVTAAEWPDGRPAAKGADEVRQEAALASRWATWSSPDKSCWESMQAMLDRLRFMARWQVLIVDPPDGWAVVADRMMDESTVAAVWGCFLRAHEDHVRGKAKPSEPSRPESEGHHPPVRT